MEAMDSSSLSSLVWIIVPIGISTLAFFGRKWYLSYRLSKTGIGRGAPGFQTNVRKIAVTPEIAARLRRGETVSPEEIAACQNQSASDPVEKKVDEKKEVVNEWLPPSVTAKKTPKRGKRR